MAMTWTLAGEAQQDVEEKADGRLRGGSEDAMREDESVVRCEMMRLRLGVRAANERGEGATLPVDPA
jgi:hypothetical protein